MKIAVIGIGAMGSLFAARLSTVAEVVMIGSWPEQFAALQKGLQLIHIDGKTIRYKIPVRHHVGDADTVDWVLVLVKSYQTLRAAKQAKQLLANENALNGCLTLQNGAGNLEKLKTVLDSDRTFAGTTTQAAKIVVPGVVQDTGLGSIVLEASILDAGKRTRLSELFLEAGFTVQYAKDIQSLIWGKLVVNTGINPLTAILNLPNGAIEKHKTYREIMFQLAEETAQVAVAQRIVLPYSDVRKQLIKVAQTTADNRSSMLRDVLRHSPTEIDAICGEVIRKGAVYGIDTPLNTAIFKMIREIEAGQRTPDPNTDLSGIIAHIK